MSNKILVTGGAGFIGRSIVPKLVKEGLDVTVYDSMVLGNDKGLEGATLIRGGDVRNYYLMKQVIEEVEPEQVLHLAAPSSMLIYLENPLESTIVTYEGFLNLMELCRKYDVENMVFASTSAVYEGLPTPWSEEMICKPPDLKSLSKLQNEEVARLYAERYGITSVALRPLSVYGVGEHTKGGYANVISLFVWAMLNGKNPYVWGDGTQKRDFIYVEDCATLIYEIMKFNFPCLGKYKNVQKRGTMEIFNVGTGVETGFNEVVELINIQLSTNYQPIYVDVPIGVYSLDICADMNKVERVIGWLPSITVEEGIAKIIVNTRKLPPRFGVTFQEKYTLDRSYIK